ncbi:MAG: protein tyrosine phosphatase [Myxococcales bacterium]|nr:protein tyrosine phosphatase [Myxococcales bacterium]
MSGFVDLHSHYIPGVDDGVRSHADGVALCQGLAALGYAQVVATPHIRTAMFDNRRGDLEARFARFADQSAGETGMPELGLGAEHFCDDVFIGLFERGEALPYPGGKALLIELPSDSIPLALEQQVFKMNVRGVRPVLAHPERYSPLFRRTHALDRLLNMGVLPLLDIMSLTGKYGRWPRRASERMLEEGVYYAACSDCHKPEDVPSVGAGIERLRELVGQEEAQALLGEHPRAILRGEAEP